MHRTLAMNSANWIQDRRLLVRIRSLAALFLVALTIMMQMVLLPGQALAEEQGYPVSPTIQLDAARKIGLGDMCPPPSAKSIRRASGTFTITLNGGDVGRCPGDDTENFGSAFRERAMINGVNYPKRGHSYRFSALVRFDENTRSADSTVFFEVHQWLTPQCSCYPIIMVYVMADGTLEAETSSYSETRYLRHKIPGWRRSDLVGRWVEVAADVSTVEGVQTARVYLGGELVYEEHSLIYQAGAVRPHFGLYRPGNPNHPNPTDRIFIRDMRAVEIK